MSLAPHTVWKGGKKLTQCPYCGHDKFYLLTKTPIYIADHFTFNGEPFIGGNFDAKEGRGRTQKTAYCAECIQKIGIARRELEENT